MRPTLLREPLPEGIEVFQVKLDLAAPLAGEDWSILGESERHQSTRLHRHADRVRFVSTRSALRRVIGEHLHRFPQDLRFVTNPFGKPCLDDEFMSDSRLHFNVSHAGEFALIAVSRQAVVGIDIERKDPELDADSLMDQTLSAMEQRLPVSERLDFFECWTAKEAVLKALGLGVGEHLRRLTILMSGSIDDAAHGSGYQLHHEMPQWPALAARRIASPAGYAACLAWYVDPWRPLEKGTLDDNE